VIRAVAVLAAALLSCAAAPASADESPDGTADTSVHLTTTGAFTQPSYVSTDPDVRFALTVANTGAVAAEDVRVEVATELYVDPADLGPLADPDTALRLEPGERVGVEVPVAGWSPLRVQVTTFAADRRLGELTIEAPMTELRGSVTGRVYGDRDGDQVVDPGEGLVGGMVTVNGGSPWVHAETRTDVSGTFTFPDLPAGHYTVYTTALAPEWEVVSPIFYEVGPGLATWVVRAVRVQDPALTASVAFDRQTYAPGDPVRLRVVVANTGTTELAGVNAICDDDLPHTLGSARWGELATGTTIGPGVTRTFDVTDVVPAGAAEYGFVSLSCRFVLGESAIGPVVRVRALVPGRTGAVDGQVCRPGTDPCVPVPGLPVQLVDDTGRVVAGAVAGPDGRFRLTGTPAGRYEICFTGPWRHAPDADAYLQVLGGRTVDRRVDVVPGPVVANAPEVVVSPVAARRPAPAPARLADTGVPVSVPLTTGLLMVLVGAGLLLLVRPRDVH
jgi:hypothetical protein